MSKKALHDSPKLQSAGSGRGNGRKITSTGDYEWNNDRWTPDAFTKTRDGGWFERQRNRRAQAYGASMRSVKFLQTPQRRTCIVTLRVARLWVAGLPVAEAATVNSLITALTLVPATDEGLRVQCRMAKNAIRSMARRFRRCSQRTDRG
jgi:hypothetical protein